MGERSGLRENCGLACFAEFVEADRRADFADLLEVETIEGGTGNFAAERGADLAEGAEPGRLEALVGPWMEARDFARVARTTSLSLLERSIDGLIVIGEKAPP